MNNKQERGMNDPTSAIATRQSSPASLAQPLPANTMADLVRAGELLAQSGMFGIRNPGAGFVVAATCHQQGISLMEFHRTYHIVDDRPSMRADAMLAELRKRGGKHRIVENSTTRAAVEIEFDGQKLPFEFTMDNAKRTGDCYQKDGKTLKHTWVKRPEDMLWARCISRAVRRICPEIVSGLYTPEEVSDFDDRPGRREPITITAEVASGRAATAAAAAVTEPEVDYSVCPEIGSSFDGMLWTSLDIDVLKDALASDFPEITSEHKNYIHAALESKGVTP